MKQAQGKAEGGLGRSRTTRDAFSRRVPSAGARLTRGHSTQKQKWGNFPNVSPFNDQFPFLGDYLDQHSGPPGPVTLKAPGLLEPRECFNKRSRIRIAKAKSL